MQEKTSSIIFHPEFFLIFPILGIILLNTAYLHRWEIGILFGIGYFFILLRAGKRFFFPWSSPPQNFWYGTFFILSLLTFSGALMYFFFGWNILSFTTMLILPALCLFVFSKKSTSLETSPINEEFSPLPVRPVLIPSERGEQASLLVTVKKKIFFDSPYWVLGTIFFLLEGIIILFFFGGRTLEATNSPWNFIDYRVFFLFFLSSFLLTYIVVKYPTKGWNLLLSGFHIFMILSLPILMFPLGFGFDPFVHQATLKHILIHGVITPKPLYYLGSYAFILFLENLFLLPLSWLYTWSFPLLMAWLLPLGIWSTFQKKLFPLFALPLLLIFPFTLFTTQTPQAYANLILFLFLLFLVGPSRKKLPKKILFFFSSAILGSLLSIHPLSGMAGLIFFFLFTLKRTPLWLLTVLTAFPSFIFLLLGFLRGGVQWKPHWNLEISTLLPKLGDRFSIFENVLYIFQKNIFFVILFAMFVSFFFSQYIPSGIRKKSLKSFCIVAASGILVLSFLTFPSLIGYEQEEFGKRLLHIALYPLILWFLFFLLSVWEKNTWLFSKKRFVLPLLLILSLLQLSAFYISFPRKDHWEVSKLYNLSSADLLAIDFIEKDAKDEPYIVLANQITSAGALQKFGFDRFYKTSSGELYFYPIPTSSPLYELYLKMSEGEPTIETIQNARLLMNVNRVYMIFDSYWTNFQKQKKKIEPLAKHIEKIEDGKAMVFRF